MSSSAQQREIVSVVSDDPMLQQIQIITGYIAQARQANRYEKLLRDYIEELKFYIFILLTYY